MRQTQPELGVATEASMTLHRMNNITIGGRTAAIDALVGGA